MAEDERVVEDTDDAALKTLHIHLRLKSLLGFSFRSLREITDVIRVL